MFVDVLKELVDNQELDQAKHLLKLLLDQMLSEFKRGLADHDYALIQNTGVLDGYPIHIDVGQFIYEEDLKNPEVYHQSLFNKTYKFRIWLRSLSPSLADYFDQELESIIGPKMHSMTPYFLTMDN